MKIKSRLLYNLLVLHISKAISVNSIVRLKCNACEPNPEKCCMGTAVLTNLILTTSFCALSCQYVKDGIQIVRVVRVFVNNEINNFKQRPYYPDQSSVGLVLTDKNGTRKINTLSLSPLELTSAIGLKALIPILDPVKPRLQVTIIIKCEKILQGSNVCASKRPSHGIVCHQEQGIPLIVLGKVIGITAQVDPYKCRGLQNTFMALGPYHSWIKSVVNSVKVNDTLMFGMLHENYKHYRSLYTVNPKLYYFRTGLENITLHDVTDILTVSSEVTKTALKPVQKTHNSQLVLDDLKESNLKNKVTSTTVPKLSLFNKSITSNTTKTLKVSPTKRDRRTAITANLDALTAQTATRWPSITFETSTLSTAVSKKEVREELLTTNVMQWFREKIKKKLEKDSPPILILTTAATEYYFEPTPFQDLT